MKPKIGDIVLWGEPLPELNKPKDIPVWPAIVYKLWPEPHHMVVGLHVFLQTGLKRLDYVPYSETHASECWSFKEE